MSSTSPAADYYLLNNVGVVLLTHLAVHWTDKTAATNS